MWKSLWKLTATLRICDIKTGTRTEYLGLCNIVSLNIICRVSFFVDPGARYFSSFRYPIFMRIIWPASCIVYHSTHLFKNECCIKSNLCDANMWSIGVATARSNIRLQHRADLEITEPAMNTLMTFCIVGYRNVWNFRTNSEVNT